MTAYKKSNSGYLPFIQKNEYEALYSTIQNRAKIDSSLKVIFGNERVHVNSLNLLTKEFGPNGESVYEPDNGDTRIRFFGRVATYFSTDGQHIRMESGTDNKGVEITFYGTGLNIIGWRNGGVNRNLTLKVDNNSASAFVYDQVGNSAALQQRNYKMNAVISVVSNLSLGWHTVLLTHAEATEIFIFGFEILNESSQITVKAGKAHGNGYEYELANDQLIDYKLGFDNVADLDVGTKGGRAVVYLDPATGVAKKRLTKVDATPAYLASANHSNEAPYRKINFREFGRNRGDDFSTLSTSASNRAFTLDDGVTTLIGKDVSQGSQDALRLRSASSYWSITFIGVGLDLVTEYDGLALNSLEFKIDGVTISTITSTLSVGKFITKVCSGLPYGTHTFSVNRTGFTEFDMYVTDFIIYQPKKPILPQGAIELATYNIMGNFTANTVAGAETLSSGVLRKISCLREGVFVNGSGGSTNWAFTSGVNADVGYFRLETDRTTNAVFQQVIFGTGFDFRFLSDGGAATNIEVRINGVLATAANFPSASFSTYGGPTFNSSTGILDQTGGATASAGFIVTGLDLQEHTVTFTRTAGGGTQFRVGALDIITPIHFPHITFGSLSLKDCRNFDSKKDVNKIVESFRSQIKFNLSAGSILNSSNIAQMLKTNTGEVFVYFDESYNVVANMYGMHNNDGGIDWDTGALFDTRNLGRAFQKLNTLTSAGGVVDATTVNANWIEKLQKDELEE